MEKNRDYQLAVRENRASWLPPEEAELSPAVRHILARFAAAKRYDPDVSPEERRRSHEEAFLPLGLPDQQVTFATEFSIQRDGEPLRVRLYRPRGCTRPPPVLIYFHGGGMTVGSLEQYDSLCQRLCEQSGVAIISVDYSLSPEKPYPAAVNDAWYSLLWAMANGTALGLDASQLSVGGDSAGGNLAAVMTLMARDEGFPELQFQLLIYPAVGTKGLSSSMEAFEKGYLFEKDDLEVIYSQYLQCNEEIDNWQISPLLAKDHSGLPPAFVISAQYEIMRDDIEEYAAVLRRAGVSVELIRYDGMIHPFLNMAGVIPEGAAAIDDCAARLKAGATTVRKCSG